MRSKLYGETIRPGIALLDCESDSQIPSSRQCGSDSGTE